MVQTLILILNYSNKHILLVYGDQARAVVNLGWGHYNNTYICLLLSHSITLCLGGELINQAHRATLSQGASQLQLTPLLRETNLTFFTYTAQLDYNRQTARQSSCHQ